MDNYNRQDNDKLHQSENQYNPPLDQDQDSISSENAENVEVTKPKRSSSFFKYSGLVTLDSNQQEHEMYAAPKRSSLKSMFAAFLAGAVVVGSLMFAADKYNLFTVNGTSQVAQSSSSSAGAGGAQTASYNTITNGSIASIAKEASPAVVKIETKVKASKQGNSMLEDPFLRQFFGYDGSQGQSQQNQSEELQPSGSGSGFIFQSTGYILTNEHVVDGADEINVYVQGHDEPYKATLLGNSYDLDLAVLKIEGDQPFPTLPIGNSDDVQVGDWVVAIGNPYDFDYTVTSGVISAKERPISIPDSKGTRNYKHLFQTDTAINPGNSGGPLLNMNGEVIGINTAVSADAQGIGFAIPTSTISSVLENLKNNVSIPKEPSPYIGVGVQEVTEDLAKDLNLPNTKGAYVADVQPKTPGFEAGLRPYDTIIAVNGTELSKPEDLTKKIQASKVGDKVKLTVIRDGKQQEFTVTVGDRNATEKK
ncbi:S1C family serine protease [Paenibacillus sp. NPDC056579]|uniref:S1C family serine protease n=1 Tax=Paenibacillus sp. NPDC056579 TaxID=3345871 RepID=UPI003680096E